MSNGINKYYFFTSTHVPKGKYNEVHPCSIVRTQWREQGWYLNSFYRISKFKGYKIHNVSFGLVSGYRKYRIPYICKHHDGGFTMPCWMLPGTELYYIHCTYGDKSLKTSWKLLWQKWWKKDD
jgi:hypothetical protein